MMGPSHGTCEIVESTDEFDLVPCSKEIDRAKSALRVDDRDRKLSMLKGHKFSVEDDLNQLFEAINLKASAKGLSVSHQASMDSLRKNPLKKPVGVGFSYSPRSEISETISLKQALRGLSISHASEMAALKRSSMTAASPRVSESGRIKSLYKSVLVESSESGLSPDEGKGGMVEICLMPEESSSNYSQKISQYMKEPQAKLSNQSAQFSPRFAGTINQKGIGTTQLQINEIDPASEAQNQMIKKKLPQAEKCTAPPSLSCPNGGNSRLETTQYMPEPTMRSSNQISLSSPQVAGATTQKGKGNTPKHTNEIDPTSTEAEGQTTKEELAQTEKHTVLPSLSCPNGDKTKLELSEEIPTSTKLTNKGSATKPARKGRLQTVTSSGSISRNRVTKLTRNNPRLVKPVVRNRNFVKKKLKQEPTTVPCSSKTYNEVNGGIDPGSQLVCQRCQCALGNARKESGQGSSVSHSTRVGAEVSSSDVNNGGSEPTLTTSSGNRSSGIVVKVNKNSNLREKGEFSQSSKSSLGEYSTSTSGSEESNLSGSIVGNRPHMSKDARWEAIRHIQIKNGTLGLEDFNLLKKLGCGDIGTVYLAELIGTNSLFAIKVMDNEYLARRKKMPRAQTEREILRMLDHPFLPTLYAQFTSDNLSCLVMEYCPGGDLHVLRQKQPGRNFPEQAARFYVAEVLLALEYLHMLGVVYRDLKPENILVREDGHIMLTDFDLSLRCTVSPTLMKSSLSVVEPARMSGPCTGSSCIDPFCIEPSCQVSCFSPRLLPAAAKARKLKSDRAALLRSLPQLVAEPTDARSNSFVGTHEYLAPEIIKGEGHGSAVDWWTFGIFLYELLYGKTPFKGSGNEETLAQVVFQSLKFPDSPLVSFQARDLIRGLLVKEPENRLGSERGAAEIKQHPFFEGLNWALIRCAIPPELPEIYDYGVTSTASQENNSKYLEYSAAGEHLEFELF